MPAVRKPLREEIFERRLAGETFVGIARAVKRSETRVRDLYYGMLADNKSPVLLDEVRDHEDQVIMAVRSANWDAAMGGDDKASAIVLRTVDQRLKLYGANAPAEITVNVIDVVQAEIARLREILGRETPGPVGGPTRPALVAANGDRG